MSNVWKAMRLDYYTLKANYRMLFGVYALIIFVGALKQPSVIILIAMMFSVTFSNMAFNLSEKNNLGKLYGTLPLRRTEFVIGRYLYTLLFGMISMVVSGSLAYIISLLTKKSMDQLTLATYLSFSFLYFSLSIGIAFPTYFKFGFSKAFMFTMLPLYVIFIAAIFIGRKADVLRQMFQYFVSHQYMIWVTGIGVGLLLLTVSCLLSSSIYKTSEL